jgi:putative DNA primase/helicase
LQYHPERLFDCQAVKCAVKWFEFLQKPSVSSVLTLKDYHNMTLIPTLATQFSAYGANILAIEKGKKRPVGEWQSFLNKPQNSLDISSFNWIESDRIGIVNGINNWRNIDVDGNPDLFIVQMLLKNLGLPEDYPWVELSQSGNGWHIWILSEGENVEGFPNFVEGSASVIHGDIPAGGKIEVRWKNNQTIVAASANPSLWLNGIPTSAPTLVPSNRVAGAFLSIAIPKNRKQKPEEYVGKAEGDRPGDDFNARGDIGAFLVKHGWQEIDRSGEVTFWRRPGKREGTASATLNYYPGLFYVFSTNAEPFEANKGYSYFATYAILEHNGNFKDATSEIRRQGYGSFSYPKATQEQIQISKDARYTDLGNAEVFAQLHGEHYRFDRKRKDGWLHWNGVAWREDERGSVEQEMLKTIRFRGDVARDIRDDAKRAEAQKWALRSESGKHYLEALTRVKTMPEIVSVTTDFDTDPYLITTANETINLKTGVAYEPRKEDFITKQANIHYDIEAEAPIWSAFISDIFEGDEEIVRYVQKALGMCLTGDITEQAFFICYGIGANGKSTLLNTIRKVLGDYAATTSFQTFDADNRNEYGNDMAALKGRRFVVAIEAEQNKKLAEARVKTITGGDSISCRFLYGEFFEYNPTYKVWLAVNHKPLVRGADHGIWRRIHLIPFNVKFVHPEEEGDKYIDRDLESKLINESSGIFNWLLEGLRLWQLEGLRPPKSIQEATELYKTENDATARWINENTIKDAEAEVEASDAYLNFKQYLIDQGEQTRYIPNMTFWGHRMSEKGYTRRKNSKGRTVYTGFKLIPTVIGV